eukprot:4218397-Prymnesium_polylepis.1
MTTPRPFLSSKGKAGSMKNMLSTPSYKTSRSHSLPPQQISPDLPAPVLHAISCGTEDYRGWLEKKSGGKVKSTVGNMLAKWDRRWCVIVGGIFCYFKSEDEATAGIAAGILDVHGASVQNDADERCFSIRARARVLALRTASADEAL